jgi:hypothetical protein
MTKGYLFNMSWVGTKNLFANFSIGHAELIDPSYLRMTGNCKVLIVKFIFF